MSELFGTQCGKSQPSGSLKENKNLLPAFIFAHCGPDILYLFYIIQIHLSEFISCVKDSYF